MIIGSNLGEWSARSIRPWRSFVLILSTPDRIRPVEGTVDVFNDQPDDLAEVRIVALLPNPAGTDAGNEQVTIRNDSASDVNLTGWVLRDRAGNEFALGGTVQTATPLVITMGVFSMPLNNSGDEVSLIDDQGIVRHQVEYQGSQVTAGGVISFP